MSTRCNVIIKDDYSQLIFYRHSDGYPNETLKTLKEFMQLVKDKKIRNNVCQCSGWLVLIGAKEYGVKYGITTDWKVGSYEPTSSIHGDIEYLYVLDLIKLTITVSEVRTCIPEGNGDIIDVISVFL